MKIIHEFFLLKFLIVGASGTLILGNAVLTSSSGQAQDRAVVFTNPKDGEKIRFQSEILQFKGKVVGFESKEIRALDLKVSVARGSTDREVFDVRSNGTWQARKRFSSKGNYTIRAFLIDKNNQQLAETKITITLE